MIDSSKSILFFYFTGTGNTWWITKELSKQLGQLGWDTRLISIESVLIRTSSHLSDDILHLIEKYDIVGFGFPIYGSDAPIPMRTFIEAFPSLTGSPLEGKKCLTYVTQMMFSGDGGFIFHKTLCKKGFDHLWSFHFVMPNNITVPGSPFAYITSQAQIDQILQKVQPRLIQATRAIHENRRVLMGKNPVARLMGWMQRAPYQMESHVMHKKLGVDSTKCTKCNLCVSNCPTANISLQESGIQFSNKCTLCLRCYNWCPMRAIVFGKKRNFDQVPAYRGPPEFKLKLIRD
jgi:ferredoxin/flavodoxin